MPLIGTAWWDDDNACKSRRTPPPSSCRVRTDSEDISAWDAVAISALPIDGWLAFQPATALPKYRPKPFHPGREAPTKLIPETIDVDVLSPTWNFGQAIPRYATRAGQANPFPPRDLTGNELTSLADLYPVLEPWLVDASTPPPMRRKRYRDPDQESEIGVADNTTPVLLPFVIDTQRPGKAKPARRLPAPLDPIQTEPVVESRPSWEPGAYHPRAKVPPRREVGHAVAEPGITESPLFPFWQTTPGKPRGRVAARRAEDCPPPSADLVSVYVAAIGVAPRPKGKPPARRDVASSGLESIWLMVDPGFLVDALFTNDVRFHAKAPPRRDEGLIGAGVEWWALQTVVPVGLTVDTAHPRPRLARHLSGDTTALGTPELLPSPPIIVSATAPAIRSHLARHGIPDEMPPVWVGAGVIGVLGPYYVPDGWVQAVGGGVVGMVTEE